jgi:hypothetical protein
VKHHHLVGQYVRNYIYGEDMTTNILKLNKIISIDDDFIILINVQMKIENNRWISSDVLGSEKIKLKYPRTTSKNKKDKVKLHQKAIDNLNLQIYKNDSYFPEWTNHYRDNYSSSDTFEIYQTYRNRR